MVKQDNLEQKLLLVETSHMQVLYNRQTPTKAVLSIVTKDDKANGKSITLDFGDMLAPESDYVKSFLVGVLGHPEGHIFHFDDVECIPHHESPFIFYPANMEYLLQIVNALSSLGLFCWEVESLSFSMLKRYHESFRNSFSS